MTFTPSQVMAVMYPNGISVQEMSSALEFHSRLVWAEQGEEVAETTGVTIPTVSKTIRTAKTTANLVRKEKALKTYLTPKNGGKKQAFLAELKKGGTIASLTKAIGANKAYGYSVLHDLKKAGVDVVRTVHPETGLVTHQLIES